MIDSLLDISLGGFSVGAKEIIPVFFYILGFYLIYLHIDKREELLRFDKTNLQIYREIRNNIKARFLLPSVKNLIQTFCLNSLQDFRFERTIERPKDEGRRDDIFFETVELLSTFIRDSDNFDATFMKANFQTEIEQLMKINQLKEIDSAWDKIENLGKYTNYCIILFLLLSFISLPVTIINLLDLWIIWGIMIGLSGLHCCLFHQEFSKNKKTFSGFKKDYFVQD